MRKKVWCQGLGPTVSRSLCLPWTRMHFCSVAARRYGRRSRPRKASLNCTIPALVNNSVGSPAGTSDELGTTVCPRSRKNPRKVSVTCCQDGRCWFIDVTPSPQGKSNAPVPGGTRAALPRYHPCSARFDWTALFGRYRRPPPPYAVAFGGRSRVASSVIACPPVYGRERNLSMHAFRSSLRP